MTDEPITPPDIEQSDHYKVLGPHYFSSRRFCEKLMEDFDVEQLKPLVKAHVDGFSDKLWSLVQDALVSDTESNVQTHIRSTVDQIVKGILSGEKWVMDRYALGERYDCEKVRAAIARHIPRELQDARIADLEAELARVNTDLKFYKDRY